MKKRKKKKDKGALKKDWSSIDGLSTVDGLLAIDETTGAAKPSGAGWTTTSASGSLTSPSTEWTESSISSLIASVPPRVDGTVSSMET